MRNYRLWIGIGVALVLLFLGGTAGYLVYLRQQTAVFTYEESDRTLSGPARGMYTQLYHTENPEWMDTLADAGRPLALITMDLQHYTDRAIAGEELTKLQALLKRGRERGVMVIFRASYKQDESMEEPSLDQIHEHIRQLSQILNDYSDVVLAVQAGMVGLWGEWHTSVYLRDENALREEAGQVVRWWLDSLDEEIVLNLRRPSYIRVMEEAGMDASRLGYHDDGLLGSDTDLGTYADRKEELSWCAANLNGRFNGGEMPYLNEFSEPENAVKEFGELALTYLNYDYNTQVLNDWRGRTYEGENAYDYIERHLGYRYYVKELQLQRYLFRSQGGFHLELQLANSGFSTIHRRFHLYLVVDDGNTKQYIRLENQGREKSLEVYEADVKLTDFAPVRLGFCYTDNGEETTENALRSVHSVEFANDEAEYEDGINYFLRYEWDGRLENRLRLSMVYYTRASIRERKDQGISCWGWQDGGRKTGFFDEADGYVKRDLRAGAAL